MSGSQSINPATGELLAAYPWHSEAEIAARLDAAAKAFGKWKATAVDQRSLALTELGGLLRQEAAPLAELITMEMGKPIARARGEVEKCAVLCDWYGANAARLLADEFTDLPPASEAVVRYEPLGVVLGVMPWNFPLWQVLRAAVPVLAAGNAFVLKHADNVQGSAFALERLIARTSAPSGIFANLNCGRGALPSLIADPRIVGVSVTAGVAAGSAIAAEAGRNLKRSVLELGGSDPFIVLADADLDLAVPAAVEARFQNSGQVCIAGKRIIVEEPIADEFTSRFVRAVAALKVGDPFDPATDLGPIARRRQRDELVDQVERSIAMGAKVLLKGEAVPGPGAFLTPTVLTDVTPGMPVFAEETFGPVAPIIRAASPEAALALANNSEFGLCGSIWTRDIVAGKRLAEKIESGGLFINRVAVSDPRVPIGGIRNSGYGRELSHFGIREFCNVKLIMLPKGAANAATESALPQR